MSDSSAQLPSESGFGPVGLVLLAAGGSRRMGQPKQLLPFRGQSLLRHVASVATVSVCRPVIVVLGSQPERMRSELKGLQVVTVVNDRWQSGMASSLRLGLQTLKMEQPNASGVLFLLCDQPAVTPALLDEIVATFRAGTYAIVAAGYPDGSPGVPALFAARLFARLGRLQGEEGGRVLFREYTRDLAVVPFPQVVVDVDTPEDYERLRSEPSEPRRGAS